MSPTKADASLAHNAHWCSTSIIHARDRPPVASRGHRLHAGGLRTHRVTTRGWTTCSRQFMAYGLRVGFGPHDAPDAAVPSGWGVR